MTYGDQPYPVVLPGFEYVHFNRILEAMLEAGGEEEKGSEGKKDVILQRLEKALRRARGKRKGLAREWEEAGDPASARDRANLLLARLHQVPKGADRVVLTGFRGEEVEISLDPALPPQENAELLYEEAARLERIRDRLPPLMKETEEEIRTLEELRGGLAEGSVHPLDVPSSLLPEAGDEKSPPKEKGERLPYDRYRSSGGLEIRVGRGSKDNDDLTFHHSDPDDVWLHARQAAGAHVILRWTKEGAPPTRDLAEAGVLAALHSRARNAGTVPVDWTRRKYVRKPRKAPPGAVAPDRIRTIFVEPDPELPERLRRRA
jgi:predicted ribosome quality control (RQC) complex YloA/Tae2 family protein